MDMTRGGHTRFRTRDLLFSGARQTVTLKEIVDALAYFTTFHETSLADSAVRNTSFALGVCPLLALRPHRGRCLKLELVQRLWTL